MFNQSQISNLKQISIRFLKRILELTNWYKRQLDISFILPFNVFINHLKLTCKIVDIITTSFIFSYLSISIYPFILLKLNFYPFCCITPSPRVYVFNKEMLVLSKNTINVVALKSIFILVNINIRNNRILFYIPFSLLYTNIHSYMYKKLHKHSRISFPFCVIVTKKVTTSSKSTSAAGTEAAASYTEEKHHRQYYNHFIR